MYPRVQSSLMKPQNTRICFARTHHPPGTQSDHASKGVQASMGADNIDVFIAVRACKKDKCEKKKHVVTHRIGHEYTHESEDRQSNI